MNTVLSLFLFAVVIAYVEYRFKKINRDNNDDQKGAFDYFATKEELHKAVKKLSTQAEEDRTSMKERMESLEQKAFFSAEIKKAEEEKAKNVVVEDPDPSVIYFRWPADDGTFTDAQRVRTQTEETYYEFHLDETRTKASFVFVTMSDTQLSKANNSSKKYIERACDFTGSKSQRFTCTPGTALLSRGKWVVEQKARIDYQ